MAERVFYKIFSVIVLRGVWNVVSDGASRVDATYYILTLVAY